MVRARQTRRSEVSPWPGGWLGREDSNLRMRDPKSRALPLGHAPPTERDFRHGPFTIGPDSDGGAGRVRGDGYWPKGNNAGEKPVEITGGAKTLPNKGLPPGRHGPWD